MTSPAAGSLGRTLTLLLAAALFQLSQDAALEAPVPAAALRVHRLRRHLLHHVSQTQYSTERILRGNDFKMCSCLGRSYRLTSPCVAKVIDKKVFASAPLPECKFGSV